MSLREISEAEARRLILCGLAGYWSVHPRSVPVPHDEQTVVRLDGKLYLVPASEMKVTFVSQLGYVGGRAKGAFAVQASPEIQELAYAEMKRKGVFIDSEGMMETPEGEDNV